MADKLIAVSGATGQQGGSVAKGLLESGRRIRALTRNPESSSSKALAAAGAEVCRMDFGDPSSLESALAGVDALFLMSSPFEAGTDAETAQGIAAIEAAKKASVSFIVFSSVASADRQTGIPHFDSKYAIEEYLGTSGIPHAVIAPAFFYENMLAPFVVPGLKEGVFAQALPENRKLQMISYQNIGQLAVRVLTSSHDFTGKRLDIAGDELSGLEVASILSEVSGREISYNQLPLNMLMEQSMDMGLMYKWFDEVGYDADIAGLKKAYPEADWISFREWASSVDWTAILD